MKYIAVGLIPQTATCNYVNIPHYMLGFFEPLWQCIFVISKFFVITKHHNKRVYSD